MRTRSSARAALLAATMNFAPAAPIDIFRFLNVPAIVMTIRQVKGRVCRDKHERHVQRHARVSSRH
ncbi:MAG TPA: hypothetical protein VF846_13475 [Thermoanaerobaculia bacterium]|jgi:hypothetical protein